MPLFARMCRPIDACATIRMRGGRNKTAEGEIKHVAIEVKPAVAKLESIIWWNLVCATQKDHKVSDRVRAILRLCGAAHTNRQECHRNPVFHLRLLVIGDGSIKKRCASLV